MGKTRKPTRSTKKPKFEILEKKVSSKSWQKKKDAQLKDYVSLVNINKGKAGKRIKVYKPTKNEGKTPESLRKNQEETPSGKLPIPKEKLEKHSRGEGVNKSGIKTNLLKKKLIKRDKKHEYSTEQAARLENFLPENFGFLEADEGEVTRQFTQGHIASAVDITSASKQFELDLPFGPYKINYSRNGRHLLLGGKKGHVAAMDWVTKKLLCEMNVMEEVCDVRWLHVETMFAVAQKEWVYIYDNQGIELHCLKQLNRVLQMEFLPYHFLLATSGDQGWLKWLDISIGELVSQFNTKMGRLNLMVQNPYNAVLCLGHSQGTVSMWSPKVNKPLAKMLCHRSPLLGLAVDRSGRHMATSGADKTMKTWDLRMMNGPLQDYHLYNHASNLAFSDRNVLAMSMGNIVELYQDPSRNRSEKAYLRHKAGQQVSCLQFSAFEDVLGVGMPRGFSSLLVPGSGEPNFDALELNPYQSKGQRREREVKALLEKIQPDLITLDPSTITEVDTPSLIERFEAKKKLLRAKPTKVDFEPRQRAKWRSGSVQMAKTNKIRREETVREFVKSVKTQDNDSSKVQGRRLPKQKTSESVLDRFLLNGV